jgi:hypothetical protein
VDDDGDLKAGPKREIASVATLLRNDWCLGSRLERDGKMGVDADDGPLTMDRAGRLAGGDWRLAVSNYQLAVSEWEVEALERGNEDAFES